MPDLKSAEETILNVIALHLDNYERLTGKKIDLIEVRRDDFNQDPEEDIFTRICEVIFHESREYPSKDHLRNLSVQELQKLDGGLKEIYSGNSHLRNLVNHRVQAANLYATQVNEILTSKIRSMFATV